MEIADGICFLPVVHQAMFSGSLYELMEALLLPEFRHLKLRIVVSSPWGVEIV